MKLAMSNWPSCPSGRSLSAASSVSVHRSHQRALDLPLEQALQPVDDRAGDTARDVDVAALEIDESGLPPADLSLLLSLAWTTRSMSALRPRSDLPDAAESKITLHEIQGIRIFCSNLIDVVLTLARSASLAVLWGVG